MARDARDNLDHLQRATTKHQQQQPPQPKKRVAPAPPVGKLITHLSKFEYPTLKLETLIW